MKFSCLIFAMTLSTSVYANCEAGGYMIHTTATYKKTDNQIFSILRGNQLLINSIDDNSDDTVKFRKMLMGKYAVLYMGKLCGVATLGQDGLDDYDQPKLTLKLENCERKSKDVYILIDRSKGMISIGNPVSIEGPTLQKEADPILKKSISTIKLTGSSPKKVIEQDDILNLDSFPVYSTTIGKDFSVLVAELHIKNIEKYFKDEGYAYYGQQYMKFENLKVGYPVLFFSSDGKSEYAGDGSHCSQVPVIYRNIELVNRESKMRDPKYVPPRGGIAKPDDFPRDSRGLRDLGLLERFNVTNAFDMNGDGKVDVIEINGRFAYRILPGLRFEVINWGMGC